MNDSAEGKYLSTAEATSIALVGEMASMASLQSSIPSTAEQRAALSANIDEYIRRCLAHALSPKQRKLLKVPSVSDALAQEVEHKLDDVILGLAPTLTWRLLYSDSVRDRIAAWFDTDDPTGVVRVKEFGKQFLNGALARRGRKKLPVGTREAEFKVAITKELRMLQRVLKKTKPIPKLEKLLEIVCEAVDRPETPYPHLKTNSPSFHKLASFRTAEFLSFASGDFGAAAFADQWIADARNRSTESVRQDLSRHRRRPRK